MKKSNSSLSWYQEGLRFECTGCGRCCTGPSGFVWVSNDEMQAMADALDISIDLFKRKYTRLRDNRYALIEKRNLNGEFDCIFLNNKKCAVYHARPGQCRTFPWWPENLHSQESWQRAAKECEGISEKAPLVSIDTIEAELSRHLLKDSE